MNPQKGLCLFVVSLIAHLVGLSKRDSFQFSFAQILGKVIKATLLRESLFIWFPNQPSSTHFRRLDDGRRGVQVEAAGPGAVRQESLPARRIRAHEVGEIKKSTPNLLASFTCFLYP